MKRPRVMVTIDEVRLHGFDPGARSAIGDALALELTRLFGEGPVSQSSREVARTDAGTLAAGRRTAPAKLGTGIAARVHAAVNEP